MRAAVLAGALFAVAPGAASAATITTFPAPAGATSITSASGSLWAAAPGAILRINPADGSAGTLGDGANAPFTISAGPDGRVWFGEQDDDGNGAVGAVNPADNSVTRFPDDVSEEPVIEDIAPGSPPSRFMWFTEQGDDIIGRIDTRNGSVDEFQTLLNGSGVEGIAAGPDGNIWFTESDDPAIGRLDPGSDPEDPTVTEFTRGLTGDSAPGDIISALGSLWFADSGAIGQVLVDGTIVEHPTPSGAQPDQLTPGPDGAIWFTDEGGTVDRMDPATFAVTKFGDDSMSGDDAPDGITVGPDNAIWFTLPDSNRIGRLDLTTTTPTPTPTPTPSPTPTPTPTPPPTGTPGPAADTAAPVISNLALSARCVRRGGGLSASFNLSENARVLYSIRRRVGSPVRRRCPATTPHRHGPAGSSVQVGVKIGDGHAGDNIATLARVRHGRSAVARATRGRNRARIARLVRGLRPGTYQLVVRATDAAGNRSRDRIVRFWVLRR